jgi:hypothetical protein
MPFWLEATILGTVPSNGHIFCGCFDRFHSYCLSLVIFMFGNWALGWVLSTSPF